MTIMRYMTINALLLLTLTIACQKKQETVQLKGLITEGNDRVKIFRLVDGTRVDVQTNDTLKAGDEIKLVPGNRAHLSFEGKLDLNLEGSGDLELKNLDSKAVELKLNDGKMKLIVPPPTDTIQVDIYTPTVVTSIRGTELGFSIDKDGKTIVWMESGNADIKLLSDSTKTAKLTPNQMIIASKDNLSNPKLFAKPDQRLLDLTTGLSGLVWLQPDFSQWDNKKVTYSVINTMFRKDDNIALTDVAKSNLGRLANIIANESEYTFRIMGYDPQFGEEQARQAYLTLVEGGVLPENLSWGAGAMPAATPIQIEVEYKF
jgi:hypothetical protein